MYCVLVCGAGGREAVLVTWLAAAHPIITSLGVPVVIPRLQIRKHS